MFCKDCWEFVDRSAMTRCERCRRFFCPECWEEHATNPTPCEEPTEEPARLPRIQSKGKKRAARAAGKQTDYCDQCHRDLTVSELDYDTEPFLHEVYGEKVWCLLCKDCVRESYADT